MTDWMISDDKIILRGLIQLSPESSETCGKSVDKPKNSNINMIIRAKLPSSDLNAAGKRRE